MFRQALARVGSGGGQSNHFAIRLKFCAVAASKNSSLAPLGPRNRSRSSFRIFLRWAKSISTFLRSLLKLKSAGRLAPSQDRIGWFEEQLAKLPTSLS